MLSKRGSVVARLLVMMVVCGILIVAMSLAQTYYLKTPEEERSGEDYPVIMWDADDPKASYRRLSDMLSDLTPQIAVNKDERFNWDEVCKFNFWVENFYVTDNGSSKLRIYRFIYRDDAPENKNMMSLADAEAEDIISGIPEGADDYESILYIHDELVRRVSYDNDGESEHAYDIYGALVEHKAVCQGYTYAMSYIADKLDIDISEVYSDSHIWNVFPGLSSCENHIDVTWDDPDTCDRNGEPYVLHNCFCLTDKEMESIEEHQISDDCTFSQSGSGVGDNYFRRNNAYVSKGDDECLRARVRECYESGSNLIELRFADADDYKESEYKVFEALADLGYYDDCMIWKYDESMILAVGLNPPDDSE